MELEINNALIVSTAQEGCAVLGATDGSAAALNGQILVYGYNDDYFGHSEVIYRHTASDGWRVLGFARSVQDSNDLTYDAREGEYEY